jgi:hypothetical protein
LKRLFLIILFFVFQNSKSFSQLNTASVITPLKTDSAVLKHSPTKATLLSMAFPGAGQFYNKKYWKIPVIYAGFAGMGYLIHFNDTRYQGYKKAYILRLDGDSTTVDDYANIYSDDDLKTLKDFYRRNRDLSIIVTGLIYILNIIDADVDAHLFYFDVSDDLSLHIQPSINSNYQSQFSAGLSLTFNF